MDLQLNDKMALVVAASKGIGKGAALALAREGCKVVIASSNEANLAKAKAEIDAAARADVETVLMDVGSPDSISRACDRIAAAGWNIDILFTNAPGPKPVDAADLQASALQTALQVNLSSVVQLCGRFLPGMRARGFGRIINLSSSVAKEPDEGMVLSAVARAGMLAYAKTLSREVGKHGITVNSILTGSVLTDRTQQLMALEAQSLNVGEEEYLAEAARTIPAGYISTPEQFSHIVAFLASPLSMYINGVSFPVDGGYMRAI